MGVPNAVGGPQALPFSLNQHSLKMNKSEKNLALKTLWYYVLKKANLYTTEGQNSAQKISAVLSTVKTHSTTKFKAYLADPIRSVSKNKKLKKRGPVLVINDQDIDLRSFKHWPNCQLINKNKTNYFGLIKGYSYPHSLFFTKEALTDILNKFFKVKKE